MKALLKIFLVLVVLFVLLLGGAYLLLTNGGFQKRMIEKRLPAGSSLESVKVTLNSAKLEGLTLALADGTQVKLKRLDTKISPLAALFDRTIEMGALQVEGLLVDVPGSLVATEATRVPSGVPERPAAGTPGPAGQAEDGPSGKPARANPLRPVYDLAQLDWRFDIERIDVDGRIRDAAGNKFAFTLDADPIKPGERSTVNAEATLVSGQSLQAGLQSFQARLKAELAQSSKGGFDYIGVEAGLAGANASGGRVLDASFGLELAIDGAEETSDLKLRFTADVPEPERFAPDMAMLGALEVEGELAALTEGATTRLEAADASVSGASGKVLEVDLKQSLVLGANQTYTGELLDVRLSGVPLAWVNPFLGDGLFLEGAPLTASLVLAGEPGGALRIRSLQPVTAGPFNLSRGEARVVERLSLSLRPEMRIQPETSLDLTLNGLSLADRYGEVAAVDGTVSMRMVERGPENPFAGIKADLSLEADLGSLLKQPALAERYNLLGGKLASSIAIDGAADHPLRIDGALAQLRTPDAPAGRDYRFAAQTKQAGERWWWGLNLEAGPQTRPSTQVGISGFIEPASEPLAFKADLVGERVTQSDLTHLATAFAPAGTTTPARAPREPQAQGGIGRTGGTEAVATDGEALPPWAGLDGTASVKLGEIYLASGQTIVDLVGAAVVGERLLELKDLSAAIGTGRFRGGGGVDFQASASRPYMVDATFDFTDVDPSVFAKPGEPFPVRGNFNGTLAAKGAGETLESALEATQGELTITGADGVLTAFEIDGKVRAALAGTRVLGLLSSAVLEDDSYAAMAQAVTRVVPYFKDIRFNEFVLKLNRGADRRIMIPQLRVAGDNLLIDASGFVAATQLSEALDQPLNLNLSLGSKGQLAGYLEQLKLLEPQKEASEDYRMWTEGLNIGGTLADPDTGAILDLLVTAAKKNFAKKPAPSEPKASETGGQGGEAATPEEPKKKKTKEEQIIEDIGMGLDLLNSAFGN